MSEEENTEEGEKPAANSMAAFSDKLTDVGDALDLLYITKNVSGRLKFREKWPEVADYLFGPELIKYDTEGVEDKEHRAQLEEEANDRRIALKATIAEIVDKSVDAGSLLFDYVGEVIDTYGVYISTYLYAEDVVERVRPGLLATRETKSDDSESQEGQSGQAEAVPGDDLADTTSISNVSEDLNIEKDDMADTAVVAEEKEEKEEGEKAPVSDEKLSDEEKALLSNSVEISEDVKPIETAAPDTAAPPPLPPEAPVEQAGNQPPTPTAPPPLPEAADAVKPIETSAPPPLPEAPTDQAAEQPSAPPPPPPPPPVSPEASPAEQASTPPLPPEAPPAPPPVEQATAPPPIPETAPSEVPSIDTNQTSGQNPAPPVESVPDVLKPPPAVTEESPAAQETKKVEELTLPQAAKAEKGVYMAMFNALAKVA